MEDKRPVVENNLLSGKQYVASEPPVSDASDTESKYIEITLLKLLFIERNLSHFQYSTLVLDNDSRYLSAEEQSRELTRSITREVGKLSEQWNQLIDHSDNWKHSLDEFMTVSSNFISFYLTTV